MARIRSVKPEFWASEDLAECSRDARLLYVGLWNLSDEHARLRGGARYIKGQLFPYDDDLTADAVEALIDELAAKGKVVRYTVDGGRYLFLPSLAKHQRLDAAKVVSKLPAPPEDQGAEKSALESLIVPDESGNFPDESENGAEKNVLLYVTGSMEHVTGSMEHGPGRARAKPDDPDFARFWHAYPLKVAKDTARKAWAKATQRATPDLIVAGAQRYRDDPNRDQQFTAHPTTWLNGARWDDDPLPPRARASPHHAYRNPTDASAYTEGL